MPIFKFESSERKKLEAEFENAVQQLLVFSDRHSDDLTAQLVSHGRAMMDFRKEISNVFVSLNESEPSVSKRLTTAVASPLLAVASLVGAPYVELFSDLQKGTFVPPPPPGLFLTGVSYEQYYSMFQKGEKQRVPISLEDVKSAFKGEISTREAKAYTAAANALVAFDDALAAMYKSYTALASAVTVSDQPTIDAMIPVYNYSMGVLTERYNRLQATFETYSDLLPNFQDAFALCREFMTSSTIAASTLVIPGVASKLLGAVPKLAPALKPVVVAADLAKKWVVPLLTPGGVVASAGFAIALDTAEVRTIYNAWKEGKEYVSTAQGIFIVDTSADGKKSFVDELGIRQFFEEKDGIFFLAGQQAEIRPADAASFLSALTSGWMEMTKDGAIFGVALGAAGKIIKVTVKFARGTEKLVQLVASMGLDRSAVAVLERAGCNVQNKKLLEAVMQLIAKPQEADKVYKLLHSIDPKVTREAAKEIAELTAMAWKDARAIMAEISAKKFGSALEKFIERFEAMSGFRFESP